MRASAPTDRSKGMNDFHDDDCQAFDRRKLLVRGGAAGAAFLALPGLASAGTRGTLAPPKSPFAERIAKNEKITVDTSKYKKDGPYTIALITQGPFNGWGKIYNVAAQYAADKSGKVEKTLIFDAFGDPAKQIKAMQDMLAQKPDAIVLTAMSKAALAAPVDRAMRAGIPVILCGGAVDTDSYVAEVGRNLYDLAYKNALALAKRLGGRGNVVMFNGIPGTDTAVTWRTAATDAFKQYPGIKIVADQYANWSIADSKKAATAIIASQPKIDAVWTGGSEMAMGTILAFADAKKKLPVFGTTNPLNGFLRLAKQHKLSFVASPYPPAMSYYGVQAALDMLAGKPLKKYADVQGVLLKGQTTYTEKALGSFYRPQFNDDYIHPTPLPAAALNKAGFKR
jgi:ribose transport system substrate-binding protein